MSRKIAKFGPKKSSKRPFYTVKMDRHYFWDAPFRTIPKLVLLLLKWYSNCDSSPCNALLRTFLIWSTYECFYDPKMTPKFKYLIFLRYTHITPIFWAQMDLTQWDDTFPISWSNFGYLRFSGRWPFGRSAAHFMATITQSGPFWAQKRSFLARNHFFVDSLKKNCYHHDGTPKRQPFCVDRLAGWSPGGYQGPFLGQKWPENLIFLHYTHITHLFWSQTDPTQWDHNIPISWGNSGYLWFSGRCPFGCLPGCFMALIAQNGLFGGHKCSIWPKFIFWRPSPNFSS